MKVAARDRIWLSEDAKFRAMALLAAQEPSVLFIHWFENSLDKALPYFGSTNSSPNLGMARELLHGPATGRRIIFAEHHPLLSKEKEVFEKLKLAEPEVWSALDEPLLKKFGGEKIIMMMVRMGMEPAEVVEHRLISASIRKAQEKIAKKIVFESPARGMQEWLERNFSD